MISIKGNRDITILVLALFILAFFVFLFIKPSITGMASSSITASDTQLDPGESLTGTISLSLKQADKIPFGSQARLYIIDSANTVFDSSNSMLLQDFVSNAGGTWTTQSNVGFDDSETTDPNEYDWEAGIGDVFIVASDSNLAVDISDFGGLNFPSNPGTYTLIFNLTYLSYSNPIQTKSISFTINAPPTDIKSPQITSVSFKNENGSTSNFKVIEKINCSATVSDADSASVAVNYILWGSNKTSITNNGGSSSMSCTGDSWTAGKSCLTNVKPTKSDLGYWNCTIEAVDSGNNKNYTNSSVLLMINSPPILKDEIDNITIPKNQNDTSLDLDYKFDDPDDQKLNYSVSGNDHIDITIEGDGDVIIIPDTDWVGNETVKFKAKDEKGAETESNNVKISVVDLLNCISNWTCGNWSSCINGLRTRTCIDPLNCYSPLTKPNTTENCTSITVTCNPGDACQLGCIGGDSDCGCTVQSGFICSSTQNCTGIILRHKDSGTCCSIQCLSVVSTIGKSGKGGFFSEQTDKIAIGFGIIAAVVFILTIIIVISGFIKRKQAVITESFKEEKPIAAQKLLEVSPVKIRPTNINKMKEYIEQSLATKVPIRIIKIELEKAGWSATDIDHELNTARLRDYIQIKLNQGIPRAEIEQSLRMKGWSKEQIEEASKNTKVRPLI